MSKARIIAYLLFLLLILAGCNHKTAPQPSPQPSCWRWNADGMTECSLQTGVQPAPSETP